DECNDDDCDYDPLAFLRLLGRWSRNLTLDVGVEGFKGPLDAGTVGNFGFHEGINLGVPLFPFWGMGGQVGFETTQTDFHDNRFVDGARDQFFFTTGLFHRAGPCGGFQGGVVYDLLRDDYFSNTDLHQLRAEVSFCGAYQHELGFWASISL